MSVQVPCHPVAKVKNAAATREAIRMAARRHFLKESYDNVALRDIAADAGADVALISRYFGGKEKLFAEVVSEGGSDWLPRSSAHELPQLLTSLLMNIDDDEHRDHAERLLIILRSSSSPVAAAIVRETLSRDVLKPLASRLAGEAPDERASLAMALWMGVTVLRTVMAVGPMSRRSCEFLDAKLASLYEAALSEL
jgi:AcrR family transcriptional regulator